MIYSPLLTRLIEAFTCLPGVGRKSAQRMVFHLLERDRDGAVELKLALETAVEQIGNCRSCRMFSESELCGICSSSNRSPAMLCVVETPADVVAVEESGGFSGHYFVLMGHLSPLDGIGPAELGFDLLEQRFDEGNIKEVILATNSTVEGDATANFVAELALRRNIKPTRIAYGVPVGGELEYVDSGTLSHALAGRRQLHFND